MLNNLVSILIIVFGSIGAYMLILNLLFK